MVLPAVKLHQLYSLNLYDGLDVIFEDLDLVDMDNLRDTVVNKKNFDRIEIARKLFIINTVDKSIMVVGHKINDKTYLINREGKGDITLLQYKCKTENILTGIEYLYHMHRTQKEPKD